MAEFPPSFSPPARQMIAQCRREIAAAWEQVDAGRRILEQSRWLLRRWAEQAVTIPRVAAPRLAMGGSFEAVEEEPRRRFRRRVVSAGLQPDLIAAGTPVHSPARP